MGRNVEKIAIRTLIDRSYSVSIVRFSPDTGR